MNFCWHTGISNVYVEEQQGHRLELLSAIGQNNPVARGIHMQNIEYL